LTKPSNDVQVVNVKKNGFYPKIVSKNTLAQRTPTGAAVATKHLPVVVLVARVTPKIVAGTNAIPIPTIKSKKTIADQRGVSRLGSRSSSLGADERLDRGNEDNLGRHEHVSLLQPSLTMEMSSIEMKRIIVDDENGFNNSKFINFGIHATTDEVESTGAVAMKQRVQNKEYGHIGPDHGGPGHEIEQHSSLAEAVPMTLVACLTTGNDLSVCDSGGKSIHVTAASGVFDSTAPDANNNQLDPLRNVEGKAIFEKKRRTRENIITIYFLFYFCC
jgi:hypothetical protein